MTVSNETLGVITTITAPSHKGCPERRKAIKVMYQQIQEDNRWALRLAKMLDAHRKLLRYEQRAVNQLRKVARIKK